MNSLFDNLDSLGLKPLDNPNEQPSIQQIDVERLEKLFGFPFPALYSEFLLRYGICAFYDSEAAFGTPDNWDDLTNRAPADIRVFYGIDKEREEDIWSLKSIIEGVHQSALPSYLLPIAESDGLPTVVYLSCREQDYGYVYALTRKQIWNVMNGKLSTEQVGQDVFHIANSFKEFLENLRVELPHDLE